MKECIAEEVLQAYFDGELESDQAAAVASHLTSCVSCDRTARGVENENLLLAAALTPEFAESIPTERLRHRLASAIGSSPIANRHNPAAAANGQTWLQSLGSLINPFPQRAAVTAGVLAIIVLSVFLGSLYLRRKDPGPAAKQGGLPVAPPVRPSASPEAIASAPGQVPRNVVPPSDSPKRSSWRRSNGTTNETTGGVLPGERNYMKTIAALNATLKTDQPMRPGLRVDYERNLALIDQAIAASRVAARKNPKDPDAAQFMFTAYQSKVDLLNQVADAGRFNGHD